MDPGVIREVAAPPGKRGLAGPLAARVLDYMEISLIRGVYQ